MISHRASRIFFRQPQRAEGVSSGLGGQRVYYTRHLAHKLVKRNAQLSVVYGWVYTTYTRVQIYKRQKGDKSKMNEKEQSLTLILGGPNFWCICAAAKSKCIHCTVWYTGLGNATEGCNLVCKFLHAFPHCASLSYNAFSFTFFCTATAREFAFAYLETQSEYRQANGVMFNKSERYDFWKGSVERAKFAAVRKGKWV